MDEVFDLDAGSGGCKLAVSRVRNVKWYPKSFTACLLSDGSSRAYKIVCSGRLNGAQRNRPVHQEAQVGGVLMVIGLHFASVLE
jgi:hypothetical protein